MKKTIGLFIGVVALLVVAMPAMAKTQNHSRPETSSLTNMVIIDNESSALANTGLNRLSGGGTIRTGDAYANSLNVNTVLASIEGCCEEETPSCCSRRDRRCGCDENKSGGTQAMNMVVVSNASFAGANTGMNMLTGEKSVSRRSCSNHHTQSRTGLVVTGDAQAWSGNDNLVNVSITLQ